MFRRAILLSLLSSVLVGSLAEGQTNYPPLPPGMRVITGSQGAIPRNTPSLNGTCGTNNHACTSADAVAPNTYGVVQSDTAVADPAGWYWVRVQFSTAAIGWVTGYPPYINQLSPPQMIVGSSFRVVGDYTGPVLTSARCINDGVNSNATMALQPGPSGQQGTIQCPWTNVPIGNHISAMILTNDAGSSPSVELQFSVTSAPTPPVPVSPSGLRITPSTGPTTLDAKP